MALYFTTNHKIHARNIVEDGTGVNSQLPFNNDTTETLHVGEIHEGYSFIKYDHGSARLLQCNEIVEDTSSSSGTTSQPSWHTIFQSPGGVYDTGIYDDGDIIISNNIDNGPVGNVIWNSNSVDSTPTILVGAINLDATQLQITYEWVVRDINTNEVLDAYTGEYYGSFILTRNVDYSIDTSSGNIGYYGYDFGRLDVVLKLTTNGTLTVINNNVYPGNFGYQDIYITEIQVYY